MTDYLASSIGRKMSLTGMKNLYALRGKNAGCTQRMRGRIVLIAFLVNDSESRWTAAAEKAFTERLSKICLRLEKESRLGDGLDVDYAYAQIDVPFKVDRCTDDNCVIDIVKRYGQDDMGDYQEYYEDKYERDDVAVSFVLNKPFRSYAQRAVKPHPFSEKVFMDGDEYSFISFDPQKPEHIEMAFTHELMHQFGAIDYYYPPKMKQMAEKHFPRSIMLGGDEIDDLTRYVIGWDAAPSLKAIEFLRAIEDITESDIDEALRREWKK